MFKWLRNKNSALAKEPVTASSEPEGGHTMLDLLKDRRQLALWVEKYMILGSPWEENFQLLPDEDAQRELEITFAQKERLAKEYHLLRIAGVLIFVRQHYDDGSYEATLNDLAGRLAKGLALERSDVGQALDDYVSYSLAGKTNNVETLYMTRMYDDSPHYLRLKVSGIGQIAVDHIGSSFDIFRDAMNGKLA
jgi:hypothetical protein